MKEEMLSAVLIGSRVEIGEVVKMEPKVEIIGPVSDLAETKARGKEVYLIQN